MKMQKQFFSIVFCCLLCFIKHVNSECSTISSIVVTDANAFTATSYIAGHQPWKARIGGDSWCSAVLTNNADTPWIQVVLNQTYEVHSIGVAGHNVLSLFRQDDYVVNYYVIYDSVGNGTLKYVIDENTGWPKVFPRNHNIQLQVAQLDAPLITRVVRVMALPGSWTNDKVCIQFQIYGCSYDGSGRSTISFLSIDGRSTIATTATTATINGTTTAVPYTVAGSTTTTVAYTVVGSITTAVPYTVAVSTTTAVPYTVAVSTTTAVPYTVAGSTTTTLASANEKQSFVINSSTVLPASIDNVRDSHLIGVAIGSGFSGIVLATIFLITLFVLILVLRKIRNRKQKVVRSISKHQLSNTLNGYEVQTSLTMKEYSKLTREVSIDKQPPAVEAKGTVLYESIKVQKQLEYDYVSCNKRVIITQPQQDVDSCNDNLAIPTECQTELKANDEGMLYNVSYGQSMDD